MKKKFKNLITILVPRHINRSEDIKQELRKLKLIVTERSSGHKPSDDCDVYIVNTYGEMSKFLRLSNVTFIGGSLVNHGGQNPLEAVRMGNYVMHGKKVNNFKEIYKELKSLKISSEIKNIDQMEKVFVKNHNYKISNSKIYNVARSTKELAKVFNSSLDLFLLAPNQNEGLACVIAIGLDDNSIASKVDFSAECDRYTTTPTLFISLITSLPIRVTPLSFFS